MIINFESIYKYQVITAFWVSLLNIPFLTANFLPFILYQSIA